MFLCGGKNINKLDAIIVVISVFVISFLINTININNTYADYTLSMTSSGAQSINVIPGTSTNTNGVSIGVDNIEVNTTCRYGYNFTISTSVNNNNLYLNGDSSNNTSSTYFTPSNGTTTLENSANTWGYYFNGSNPTTNPTGANIFNAVPALGSNPAIIKSELVTPSSSDINDEFSIYYGVSVGNDLAPGKYKMIPDTNNQNADGAIVYQVTMASECIVQKTYMQDVTESDLATLMPNTGDVATLYDKRDEQEYAIGHAADGNYWMIQNLKLGKTTTSMSLTSTDSNVSSNGFTLDNKLSDGRFPRASSSSSSDAYYQYDGSAYYCTNNYGCYYNWYTATASSGTSSFNSGDVNYDICPAGWSLPTGGENGQFQILYNNYNTAAQMLVDNPTLATENNNGRVPGFLIGGNYSSDGANRVGVYGDYWSRNASESKYANSLDLSTSTVNPATFSSKYTGNEMRCVKKTPTITIKAGNGISTLTANGWTGSGTNTITKTLTQGQTIDLSSLVSETYKTGYTGVKYTLTSGTGSLNGSTYTTGDNIAEITIDATGLNTPTCTIQGGTGKVYNRSDTTLTATSNTSNFDTGSVNLTYSFGYAIGTDTGELGDYSTPGASNTYTVTKNAFRGARYFGVRVTVTDKNDSTITSTCTSGTGSATGTTVANRTQMTLVNAQVNFDATTYGGTLSGESKVYVAYDMTNIYAGRTNATTGYIPTAIPPAGKAFDGWYTASGDKILNADGTPAGNAVTNWITADGNWRLISTSTTTTSDATKLYAHYIDATHTVTITAGKGISSLTASGWTGTGTGTISKTFNEGDTIDLSSVITPTYTTGYNGKGYTKTDSVGTLSGSTYTVGTGDGTITYKATGLNTPTCTIQGGTTRVYNYSSTTLTATSNASNYDTSSVNLTYSFGYSTSSTGTLGSFTTAASSNTYSVTAAAYRGTRYYGVKVTATDKTDSSITSTCTSGTGTGTGTTVANRTTMTIVNSQINFDATTNGGTLSGTTPVYVSYQNTGTYSSRTGSSSRSIPTATPPSGKVFDGWYTASSGGTKVINADGTVNASVSSWTNTSKQWLRNSTSTSTSSNKLYAHYVDAYMQDLTNSHLAALMPNNGDSTTLYDKRDENDYQITKINGNYWMTQNLRITGTIPSEGSNFNNVSSWKVDQGDLDSTITTSGYNNYTAPRIHSGTDSNGDPTMWYNFCAASANNSGGCNSSTPYEAGTGNVTGDICPAGWRLPTKDEFIGITSYGSYFNIVKGGNWYNGAVNNATSGYWWTATNAYAETNHGYRQYFFVANASNTLSLTQNNTRRGEYIRCIRNT